MNNLDTIFAEAVIRALTHYMEPDDAQVILFTKESGWIFSDAAAASEFSCVTKHGWYILTSIDTGTPEPFGYRMWIDPGTAWLSVNISYNDGGGAQAYNLNLTAETPIIHEMTLTDGVTAYTADETQTTFDITVTPYDAADGDAGTGESGTAIVLKTGTTAKAGVGMVVESLAAAVMAANVIRASAPFDFARSTTDSEIVLGVSANHANSPQSGSWSPNYNDGATQTVTASGALTVGAVSNFPDGGVMNLYITTGGYDINFSGYSGPGTTFSGVSYVVATLIKFGSSLIVGGISW